MGYKGDNMNKILLIAILIFSSSVLAQVPALADPNTGKYLGNLSGNQYDPNSVSNPYGQYGSRYSQNSINNPYGKYGSQYSNSSPNNPYATGAPVIVAPNY